MIKKSRDSIRNILKIEGKYSIKRVYSAIVLIFSLIFSTYIVVSDFFLEQEINKYAIEVLEILILFTGGLLGMDEFNKSIIEKSNKAKYKPKE